MIDIKLIREHLEEVQKNLKRRNNAEYLKILDGVVEKDKKWRTLQKKTDELRKKRNDIGASVAKLKKEGNNADKEINAMRKAASEIEDAEKNTENVRDALDLLMLQLPNMLHESVPTGKDEDDNKEIRKWGKIPELDFKPKDHIDIGEALDLFDIERAAKVAGARFYYLKNDAVRLEFALVQYALDILAKEGFTLTIPPMILRERVMQGAGFLPTGEEDIYKIENNDENERLFLVGTSEQALA
ncbi:MAG: serine--tRNA ligase, partial [Candidatus Aenigmarchaeota archaeon]|nr:serine--tRNA ligase [Candidatus Aenigmarchaeota archaeon]